MLEAAIGLLTQSLVGLGHVDQAIEAREKFLPRQSGDDAAGVRNLMEIAGCYGQVPDDANERRTLEMAIVLTQGRDKQKLVPQYAELLDRLAQVLERQRSDADARRHWAESAAVYESLIVPVADEPRASNGKCSIARASRPFISGWPAGPTRSASRGDCSSIARG